ncbi:MAG: hypothetical protein ATN34_03885 [Epulopiscium sp. Nele67-Bin002]|nr:MAG: hypothetical protein ATN34_03885 [Epulopiscium sp. Nele67-Bin002]
MVCLVINGKKLPKSDLLVKQLCEIDGVCSIVINHNTNKGNVVLGDKVCVLYGKDFIEDKISELVFKISPLSFFQVNPTQTEILYNKVLEFANLAGDEIILDLYCGIGTISLFLAKAAKKVYGVEVVSMAIDNAIENAKINGIDNAEFILGKAEDAVPDIKADVVVVDPPRKGCDESVLKSIVQLSPNKIIYVSCDPATLARDVAFLDENGYNVDIVQPIDMFPHTTHVETVVLLSRN